MITDAHLHLRQLFEFYPQSLEFINENEYLGIVSCHSLEDVEFAETGKNKFLISFGVHPQDPDELKLGLLKELIEEKRIDAVGEIGFDKYNEEFKQNFSNQVKVFEYQLEIAINYGMPVILHIRKGFEELFKYSLDLKKLPAVIFHSFSGTVDQAEFFLNRGVNAFFSFGTPLLNGHRKAENTLRAISIERILVETDAPYQPVTGEKFSFASDILKVVQKAAVIKGVEFDKMLKAANDNFQKTLTKRL
jgi:TatD DNase family protein